MSSKKLGDVNEGSLKNDHLYNEKELWDDADLNWYDYGFRNYDPQIGRFTQLDPLTDSYPELTPYQYASNDPIANIDIDGLEGGSAVSAFSYSYNTSKIFLAPATQVAAKTGTLLRAVGPIANTARVGALRVATKNGAAQGAKVISMNTAKQE